MNRFSIVDGAPSVDLSEAKAVRGKGCDLSQATFCHRAFPYAPWEMYAQEESAAIAAALAASPLAGRIALPGPETGVTFEVRWGATAAAGAEAAIGANMVEVNTSEGSAAAGNVREVRWDAPPSSDGPEAVASATADEDDAAVADATADEIESSASDPLADLAKAHPESLLLSARVLFGIVDGLWRVRRQVFT